MSLVIVGTDTGVGKTVVSATLLARYARRLRLGYWKPVQTGAEEGTDSDAVRRWTRGIADVLPEAYVFREPLSPHLAARRAEGRIDPERILEALVRYALDDRERSLVVEGAGGILVPLTDEGYLLVDLLGALHLPCAVVARTTLGTINHTLLTLEGLRSRGVEVAGVILCGAENAENRRAVEKFGKTRVVDRIPPVPRPGPKTIAAVARRFDRAGLLGEYLS
jgi:dethiobiotin synthetase